ncbi:hypothetical protein VY88_10885 [Azospirillum thiophilum]|uniref:Uncharacterized protein n=1 Tax=Azospirillum thiophilum TaxID=528244 RepID=A0AAC8VUW3_9PROT|nr:hypothetical protein [Azospirillum thiophilum]ALG69870.1 hypothetical protein AL072_01825 [Azospirillum thiophilum]KJR66446.1 hypothetical protein VY88_10885 [Azospirillum thiophilum]
MRVAFLAFFVILIAASTGFAAPPRETPEERDVAATFDAARTALAERRGSAVIPLLTRNSVKTLESVRDAARQPGDAPLQRLEPAERFAAMGLRRHLGPSELRRMSVGDIANHALKAGWLGPNVVARSALGPVRVRGDRASGLLMVDNRPALVPADFVREGGVWRIDITSVFTFGSQMLKGFAAMSGKDESAYIAELLDKLPAKAGAVKAR